MPYQMGARDLGARTAYESVIKDFYDRFMYENPEGVTPQGQQFLQWALQENLMGISQLFGD